MKNFNLMIALLIIAAGTGFSVLALTLDSDTPNCNGCIARINSIEETALNKFCYPSIYSEFARTNGRNISERMYPKTWLFARTGDTSVCLQVVDRPESTVVSF